MSRTRFHPESRRLAGGPACADHARASAVDYPWSRRPSNPDGTRLAAGSTCVDRGRALAGLRAVVNTVPSGEPTPRWRAGLRRPRPRIGGRLPVVTTAEQSGRHPPRCRLDIRRSRPRIGGATRCLERGSIRRADGSLAGRPTPTTPTHRRASNYGATLPILRNRSPTSSLPIAAAMSLACARSIAPILTLARAARSTSRPASRCASRAAFSAASSSAKRACSFARSLAIASRSPPILRTLVISFPASIRAGRSRSIDHESDTGTGTDLSCSVSGFNPLARTKIRGCRWPPSSGHGLPTGLRQRF